jgi:hypothetical protein
MTTPFVDCRKERHGGIIMDFRKYMHIEKFGNDEVQGIELGICHIFPKLDGTNGSMWFDGGVRAGSRNREIFIDDDNAGFCAWSYNCDGLSLFTEQPSWRIYGEWLVPHSLRTYAEDAWRKFYVFDVWDEMKEKYLPYETYQPFLENHGFDYIPPIAIIKNASYDNLLVELGNNSFLIRDGQGCGEGIVIKNYDFTNSFGRTVWAKIITNSFKEKHIKEMGVTIKTLNKMTEQLICDKYVSRHLVDKVYAKIVNEMGGWNRRYIPRLLQTVYYDLVNEEAWNFVKEMKNPTINYRALNTLTIMKVKKIKPELF